METERKYSRRKGLKSTVVNSTPILLIFVSNILSKKFDLIIDVETLNTILLILSAAFYWVKNWIKNRTKKNVS